MYVASLPFGGTGWASISRIKIVLVLAAVIIAAVSLVVSHILVRDLAIEERNRMEVWAEAMRSLSTAEENTDLNLVLKVINENNTIPVIVTDEQGNVQTFRNVEIVADNHDDSMAVAARKAADMRASGRDIRISLGTDAGSIHVSYDESVMITRLSFYLRHRPHLCRDCHLCPPYLKESRAEQGVGGIVKRDCPPVGHPYILIDGLDGNPARDIS